GARVRRQLLPFAAREIGEEGQAPLVVPLEQDHPGRRPAGGIRRGERHGVAVLWIGGERLVEPAAELLERVAGRLGLGEPKGRVVAAPVGEVSHGWSVCRKAIRRLGKRWRESVTGFLESSRFCVPEIIDAFLVSHRKHLESIDYD